MSNVLKKHPTPWTIYDPNGSWVDSRRGVGYRPIYLHDANGEVVVYVGKTGASLPVAEFIVSAVNAKALEKIRPRGFLSPEGAKIQPRGLSPAGARKVAAIRKRIGRK